MQYLHHSRKMSMQWRAGGGAGSTDFFGTCDAAHNATWNARGITGWAYHLNGAAVSWHCKAQAITALSSTEAELIAVDSAVRELRFLHKLLAEFGQQVGMRPTVVGQDNMSTLKFSDSTHFNARTKHVSLRYHHVGSQQRAGVVQLRYLPTTEIPADLLTKPLATEPHRRHTATLLGHRKLSWPSADDAAHSCTEYQLECNVAGTVTMEGV